LLLLFFAFGFTKLVHQSWKIEFRGGFGAFLGDHELIDFTDHVEVLMEDFAFVYDTSGYLAAHLMVVFGDVANLHFEHVDVVFLGGQQFLKGILSWGLGLTGAGLGVRVVVGSNEGSLLLPFPLLSSSPLCPAVLLHGIEQIDYFFAGILHDIDQIGLLEPSISYSLRYSGSKLFVLFAGFCKVGDIVP
jgi:hypothetical protein